ncbi:major facilitator superfamily transporter [Naematelia encephala]|uniref:Major facilitator superfamily transporter n=1 Tax=Naematelia encephala TaxID=71784 RepID=A0A1Y2AN70_9TREE|nr:major facilitator superfamily transporter [Naematelia encephala]
MTDSTSPSTTSHSQPHYSSSRNASHAEITPVSPIANEQSEAEKSTIEHVETGAEQGTSPAHGKHHHGHGDTAAEMLARVGGRVEYTEAEATRVKRKIDWMLMPLMVTMYFMSFFDKQTLAFSSTYGLQTETHLVGNQYSLLGSVVYIAQIGFQPLGAFLLVRMRVSLFIPILVTCWGAILCCMAAAKDFGGLVAARFLLGAMEAAVAPGFIFVGQSWYRRAEQPIRIAVWFSQNAFVNIFGSAIAYGLGQIHGKIYTYQIIFLCLGCFTFLFGIFTFFVFPESPTDNKFLTEDEKLVAVERLRANNQGVKSYDFKMKQALGTIIDPKAWCWFALLFLVSIPSGGISTFGPLILKGFGFDSQVVLLFNIPFGAMQLIAITGCFWLSARYKTKSIVLLALMVPCLIGAGLLYGLGREKKDQPGLLAAYYILAFYTPITPMIMAWFGNNTAGSSRRTATTGFAVMGQSLGNVVGPMLFTSNSAPYYHSGLRDLLIVFCLFTGMVCVTVFWLWTLNKRNERRRVAAGKPAKLPDFSMMTSDEAERTRAQMETERQAKIAAGEIDEKHVFRAGEHAFEDQTDLENDEFVYVY